MLTAGRGEVGTGVDGLRLAVGDDGVAVLTIDRPARRNALTPAMWAGLPGILTGLADDSRVRVLLVTGAGDTFSAGAEHRGAAGRVRRPGPRGRVPRDQRRGRGGAGRVPAADRGGHPGYRRRWRV